MTRQGVLGSRTPVLLATLLLLAPLMSSYVSASDLEDFDDEPYDEWYDTYENEDSGGSEAEKHLENRNAMEECLREVVGPGTVFDYGEDRLGAACGAHNGDEVGCEKAEGNSESVCCYYSEDEEKCLSYYEHKDAKVAHAYTTHDEYDACLEHLVSEAPFFEHGKDHVEAACKLLPADECVEGGTTKNPETDTDVECCRLETGQNCVAAMEFGVVTAAYNHKAVLEAAEREEEQRRRDEEYFGDGLPGNDDPIAENWKSKSDVRLVKKNNNGNSKFDRDLINQHFVDYAKARGIALTITTIADDGWCYFRSWAHAALGSQDEFVKAKERIVKFLIGELRASDSRDQGLADLDTFARAVYQDNISHEYKPPCEMDFDNLVCVERALNSWAEESGPTRSYPVMSTALDALMARVFNIKERVVYDLLDTGMAQTTMTTIWREPAKVLNPSGQGTIVLVSGPSHQNVGTEAPLAVEEELDELRPDASPRRGLRSQLW